MFFARITHEHRWSTCANDRTNTRTHGHTARHTNAVVMWGLNWKRKCVGAGFKSIRQCFYVFLAHSTYERHVNLRTELTTYTFRCRFQLDTSLIFYFLRFFVRIPHENVWSICANDRTNAWTHRHTARHTNEVVSWGLNWKRTCVGAGVKSIPQCFLCFLSGPLDIRATC